MRIISDDIIEAKHTIVLKFDYSGKMYILTGYIKGVGEENGKHYKSILSNAHSLHKIYKKVKGPCFESDASENNEDYLITLAAETINGKTYELSITEPSIFDSKWKEIQSPLNIRLVNMLEDYINQQLSRNRSIIND